MQKMPSEPVLKETHRELLILLEKFHQVCVSHSIHYTLHGGTLLGAVREKGFIPWDNDADIAMKRGEYDKFRSVMLNEENMDEIKFDDCHRVPRLIMKSSGTFLDIFIYDPISNKRAQQRIKIFCNMFLRGLVEDQINFEAAKKRNKYHRLLYWGYGFLQKVGKFFRQEDLLKKFNRFNKNRLCGSGKLIFRSNDGYPGMNIFLPVETMSQYEMVPFEDTELMISSDYDLMLTTSYGDDYMVPQKFGNEDIEVHEIMKQQIRNQIEKGK